MRDPSYENNRFRGGHKEWAEAVLSVRNKAGNTVPYVLQPAQLKLDLAIQDCRRRNRPVRIIYLKARQVMVSTATAAQFIQQIAFTPGQKARIVSHEKNSALDIFSYYNVFDSLYQPNKDWPYYKLNRVRDASLQGMIGYEGGGYIHVQSADTVQGGRGSSLRFLHLSEYAFWRDAKTLITGLLQAVPDDPDTMIVKESTANGMGGPFYEDWLEACRGDSEWLPIFFGWWEHPEYQKAVEDPARFQASLTREENDEQRKYTLSLVQLHWRRWAIKNKCQGSVDLFRQEYPGNPEEAFLRSGRPRFHVQSLDRMRIIRDPLVGDLIEEQTGPRMNTIFLPNDEGLVTLYKKPAEGHEYIIGIDVAEGLDQSTSGSADPDWSVAEVIDRDNGEQVCMLRGRVEPGPFADMVDILARWFNWAYIVPEANGPGVALIEVLIRDGYPPSLIYRRRPQPNELGSDSSSMYQHLGWKTTEVTRVQLISAHDMAIRNFDILIRDATTLAEHLSFVWTKRNRCEAMQGTHDDTVIALSLCTIGLLQPLPDRRLLGLAKPKSPHTSGLKTYGKRREPELRGERLRFLL